MRNQAFLWLLIAALVLGWACAEPVQRVSQQPYLRAVLVAGVMLLLSATLPMRSLSEVLRRPGPVLTATTLNLLAVPAMSAAAMGLMMVWGRTDWAGGLWVAALSPCTLASAAVWTRRGGGNDAVALATTALTGMLCVITIPALSYPLTRWGAFGEVTDVDAVSQMTKIATFVALPLVLGQTLRRLVSAGWWDRQKPVCGKIAQAGILVMVMFGSAAAATGPGGERTAASGGSLSTSLASVVLGWIVLLGLVSVVHVTTLLLGYLLAGRLGYRPADRVAVAISGSQKTLMIGLMVAIDWGVSVLPMIMFHGAQLLIDTVWVDAIARRRPRAIGGDQFNDVGSGPHRRGSSLRGDNGP